MAPWTEKTDSYAFGLLVYEVFCGGPPFQASSREAVLAKQLTEAPTPMRRRRPVPATVESIVTQALEKDRELRPWMHEMLNGLWGETEVREPSNGARSGWIGWKRTATFVGSAVTAAAAIVLTIWGLSGLPASSGRSVASGPSPLVDPAPVSQRAPSADPASRSESAARLPAPAASPQAIPRPAAPAVVPPPDVKPTPPTIAAPQPPAPSAPVAAAAPPTKPMTRDAPAATVPQVAPAPTLRTTPPDARPSSRTRPSRRARRRPDCGGRAPGLEANLSRGLARPGPGLVVVSGHRAAVARRLSAGHRVRVSLRRRPGRPAAGARCRARAAQGRPRVRRRQSGEPGREAGDQHDPDRHRRLRCGRLERQRDRRHLCVVGPRPQLAEDPEGDASGLSRVAVLYAADASSRGELASVQSAAASAG